MYRFSISWSRILPSGRGKINAKGIEFYNNLIDELLKKNIVPVVTLFHWDMPQILQEEYGGFLSPKVVSDFVYYAQVCFDSFGDRVKHWITLNEPYITSAYGFYEGINPPQRCADRRICEQGDSNEVYLVTHHQILAHGRSVELYKQKYQKEQKGTIGISLNSDWYEPWSDSQEDKDACQRQLLFQIGWFADPIWFGDYPQVMKDRVKERLPVFTEEEKNMLKGSSDFFGLNHYTSRFVRSWDQNLPGYFTDRGVQQSTTNSRGALIGQQQHPEWLWSYPKGFRKLLNWIDRRYNDTIIYVSENGLAEKNTGSITTQDPHRIKYYDDYLEEMWGAIYQDGVDVRAYLAWSFMDNFEWGDGYSARFGIVFVDFATQKRIYKDSTYWWKDFMYEQNFRKFITNLKVGIGITIALVLCLGMSLGFLIFLSVKIFKKFRNQNQYNNLDEDDNNFIE